MTYLTFIVGLMVGAAFKALHENWCMSKENENEHVVIRKFEYDSNQHMAYNTAREAFEQHTDKFKLITLKQTGCVIFYNYGIMLKYKSLRGHILKFNYDMSRFDVIDPPNEK